MAGINSISGLIPMAPATSASPTASPSGGAGKFGDMFKAYLEHTDADQHSSQTAIQDMLAGKSQDVLPVVTAMAKADMSFKLLIGVRNKVVEAYKQTMNMQI